MKAQLPEPDTDLDESIDSQISGIFKLKSEFNN